MGKSNVIDITKRIKTGKKQTTKGSEKAQVLSFSDKLQNRVKGDRRKVERIVLSQFVGVFVVTRSSILQPVSISDISVNGLSFDMVMDVGSYDIGNDVTMRIYMSHDTYFTFNVLVTNKRDIEGRGVVRHGVEFRKSQPEALYHFIKFLETVSQVAKKDMGEKVAGRVD
ncbi:MAG: PilZ domain-containing protein [Oligoflexia bacterium]|nr:PilZ domain-containing protein [Oligoflexia bacterium]